MEIDAFTGMASGHSSRWKGDGSSRYLPPVQVAGLDRAQPGGWRFALTTCRERANLRKTARIALVVGSILTLINQADVIAGGDATWLTAVKVPLNFLVPFVVSNLGVIVGARNAAP